LHAGRVVEDDHGGLGVERDDGKIGRLFGKRPREDEGEAGRSGGARDEEQDLAQAFPRVHPALGAQEQLHGGEADRQGAPLAHAMDEVGQGRGGESEQKGWRDEVHDGYGLPARSARKG
jgi:hypothetical protein